MLITLKKQPPRKVESTKVVEIHDQFESIYFLEATTKVALSS